jgi:hypothetical protein
MDNLFIDSSIIIDIIERKKNYFHIEQYIQKKYQRNIVSEAYISTIKLKIY